jgi:enoyl-CoA hydratase/carnithine racemase
MGDAEVIKFSVVGKGKHIAVFTLNRPKAMNAVNQSVSMRMGTLIQQFEADDSLWVGVLCSSHEKVFCAGADLKAISKNEVSPFDIQQPNSHLIRLPKRHVSF